MNNAFVSGQSETESDKAKSRRATIRRARYVPERETFYQPVPAWVWCFGGLGIIWGCFTSNAMLTACAFIELPLLFGLLWFRGEVPILFFACLIQWLQATTEVFRCNF